MHALGALVMTLAIHASEGSVQTERLFLKGQQGPAWEFLAGSWSLEAGLKVRDEAGINAIAYPPDAPVLSEQTLETVVVPKQRLVKEGWSVAGVLLFSDPESFWLLALTEGPDGQRYVDFLENYRGIWQAQTQGPSRLERSGDSENKLTWDYDVPYRLSLKISSPGIEAMVMDASGQVLFTAGYTLKDAPAVRAGLLALFARGSEALFTEALIKSSQIPLPTEGKDRSQDTVAILDDAFPDRDPSLVEHLARIGHKAGFQVVRISANEACDPGFLAPERFQTYIIPQADVYPAQGEQALRQFLRRKGRLVVIGAPAFSRLVWPLQGQWLEASGLKALAGQTETAHVVLDFEGMDSASSWGRGTDDPSHEATVSRDAEGASGTQGSLKGWTQALNGWDTFPSPEIPGFFQEGHDLLCFWARGDDHTSQLSVEMNEKDGSRWMAVVPLSTSWQRHVLRAVDFSYWPDSKTEKVRGGAGDSFRPAACQRIVLGLAQSHTSEVGKGEHAFWVDEIGTAPDPLRDLALSGQEGFQPIETLCPSYKVYPLSEVSVLKPNPLQRLSSETDEFAPPMSCVASFARPQGQGIGRESKWRWIPLWDAWDKGEHRGSPAWLLLHRSFPFKGSATTVFGVNDLEFLKGKTFSRSLINCLHGLKTGLFLGEAGTSSFSCRLRDKVDVGAEILNLSQEERKAFVRLVVRTPEGREVFRFKERVALGPRESKTVRSSWTPEDPAVHSYTVTTELLHKRKSIDILSHELGILDTASEDPDAFVTVKGRDFSLRGEPWFPVGVNYWPLYVSGQEPGDYSLGWLEDGFYLPDEVEADLKRMEALGINMVSIQLGRVETHRNLLDFLRRCEKHQIKVNGFLGEASPLAFNEEAVRTFIETAHLDHNPTLFAYDIIWEPGNWVFQGEQRKRWDRDWATWILEQYGSVQNAEEAWRMPAPRSEDGQITSPSDSQMKEDGDWRILVAAYRRFMDDLTSRMWGAAIRKLKEIDPHHLVSFRQGNTLPQDFALTGPVKHIDFICPEGYAIPPGEDGYLAAGFVTRYVDFTTGGKPILWSEFGQSVWDAAAKGPSEKLIQKQGEYHELFYRMVLDADADGTAPWWWPGGYRVNERSDFGILNPDGSFRPSANLIRKYAPLMKRERRLPEAEELFIADRDAHPGGYWYLTFNEGKEAYQKAREAGKTLRVASQGTGTNSCTVSLVGVGNVPFSSDQPLKYLNAEFNSVWVLDAQGLWAEVKAGESVPVKANAAVMARVSVGNTGEAEWVAPGSNPSRSGTVVLGCVIDSPALTAIPENTAYLADALIEEFTLTAGISAKTRVSLRMTAKDRAWFGQRMEFELDPR